MKTWTFYNSKVFPVCVYYSMSLLSTSITLATELDCFLFTWWVRSGNFIFRSLVIATSLSKLPLKMSLYLDCEGNLSCFRAEQESRLCWSSMWSLRNLHLISCLNLFPHLSPLVLAAKRNLFVKLRVTGETSNVKTRPWEVMGSNGLIPPPDNFFWAENCYIKIPNEEHHFRNCEITFIFDFVMLNTTTEVMSAAEQHNHAQSSYTENQTLLQHYYRSNLKTQFLTLEAKIELYLLFWQGFSRIFSISV